MVCSTLRHPPARCALALQRSASAVQNSCASFEGSVAAQRVVLEATFPGCQNFAAWLQDIRPGFVP